jgi:hypothetical protein
LEGYRPKKEGGAAEKEGSAAGIAERIAAASSGLSSAWKVGRRTMTGGSHLSVKVSDRRAGPSRSEREGGGVEQAAWLG